MAKHTHTYMWTRYMQRRKGEAILCDMVERCTICVFAMCVFRGLTT